jgi:hypothetical protein
MVKSAEQVKRAAMNLELLMLYCSALRSPRALGRLQGIVRLASKSSRPGAIAAAAQGDDVVFGVRDADIHYTDAFTSSLYLRRCH